MQAKQTEYFVLTHDIKSKKSLLHYKIFLSVGSIFKLINLYLNTYKQLLFEIPHLVFPYVFRLRGAVTIFF